MSDTYPETVLRYRIYRHEELPERHKQAYLDSGRNPDDIWNLVWSFNDEFSAEQCLADERANAAAWQTYKMVDHGQAEVIQRSIY